MKTIILCIYLLLVAVSQAQLIPSTQVQRDIASIDRAAQGTTYYGQLLVQSLNNAHAAVWSLPDDRLAAVLNTLGEDNVTRLVALQAQTATALNASLDAAGDTGARALVSPSRAFSWSGGSVVLVPLNE
jgi:hypothetical protein